MYVMQLTEKTLEFWILLLQATAKPTQIVAFTLNLYTVLSSCAITKYEQQIKYDAKYGDFCRIVGVCFSIQKLWQNRFLHYCTHKVG